MAAILTDNVRLPFEGSHFQNFILLGSDKTEVIASCRVTWSSAYAFLSAVHVRPDRRRRGFARAMLNDVIAFCRQEGKKTLSLWVVRENAAAIALYRSLGFRVMFEDDGKFFMSLGLKAAGGGAQ